MRRGAVSACDPDGDECDGRTRSAKTDPSQHEVQADAHSDRFRDDGEHWLRFQLFLDHPDDGSIQGCTDMECVVVPAGIARKSALRRLGGVSSSNFRNLAPGVTRIRYQLYSYSFLLEPRARSA